MQAGGCCPRAPACCLVPCMLHFAGLQIKQRSTLESGPAVFIEVLVFTSAHVASRRFQT